MLDRDGWAGVVLIGIFICGFYLASNLPHPPAAELGSGFFPRLLFLVLGVCGVTLLIQSVRRKDKIPLPKVNWRQVVPMAALILMYAGLLSPLGFRAATFLFLILSLLILGVRKAVYLISIPVAVSLGLHWIFVNAFRVVLP